MALIAQFSRNIRKRGSQVKNSGVRLVRATAKKALKTLVKMTPVDTGLTRSNWRVSITARTYAVIPPYSPGKKLGLDESANRRAAISAGYDVIDRLRPGQGKSLENSLYITNNTQYIGYIHKGQFITAAQEVIAGFQALVAGGSVFTDKLYSDDGEE